MCVMTLLLSCSMVEFSEVGCGKTYYFCGSVGHICEFSLVSDREHVEKTG